MSCPTAYGTFCLMVLWGRQSCLQPPFRRLFRACESLRSQQTPAESRLQPRLAAPQRRRFPAGSESRILNVSLIGRGGKCRDSPGGDWPRFFWPRCFVLFTSTASPRPHREPPPAPIVPTP